jgi:hypothetical protein
MVEREKEGGFMDMIKDGIKDGLSNISQIISASIFPPIAEGTDRVMKNIEDRIIRIEKRIENRILRKITSLLIMGLGAVFLLFALFFFLIEYFGWSKAAAFFSIGMIVFVIGLLLKAGESNR